MNLILYACLAAAFCFQSKRYNSNSFSFSDICRHLPAQLHLVRPCQSVNIFFALSVLFLQHDTETQKAYVLVDQNAFRKNCLVVMEEPTTWEKANNLADDYGKLAILDNGFWNTLLANGLPTDTEFYIGYYCYKQNCFNVDDASPNYTNWATGNENHFFFEDNSIFCRAAGN